MTTPLHSEFGGSVAGRVLQRPTSVAPPRPTTAYPNERVVRLASGVRCPHCEQTLKATDVVFDYGLTTLRCSGCHTDILTIERRR